MDYKKKFEDFLDKMQGLLDSAKKQGHIIVRVEDIENTFPELKESEDEGIRKEIISALKWANHKGVYDKHITWLERQCGQKQAHKYEPMFKVGDWVVTDKNGVVQIKAIKNDNYVLENASKFSVYYVDKCWKKWDISDAKEGDVLVDKSDGTIGIFECIGHHPDGGSYNDPSYCFLHCRYDDGDFYADFENSNTMDSDDAIPATKEQRDALMKAMTDAGYEWDADKKELKKTELHNSYKLEPNFDFSVGQWIVVPIAKKVFLITKIEGFGITLVDIDGDEYVFGVDSLKDARLWTVADAKEGDVLSNGKMIVLFKHFEEPSYKQHIVAYIGLDAIGAIQITDDAWYLGIGKTYPATKEQRELLFQKMKKAGYEWDAENKELKKIEPKFKAGNWYQCTKDFFGKGVTFDKNTAYYCAKEGCLQCEYGCHIAIVKDLYDNFKLWTISDAKDGDVLYSLDSNQPFIYKARNGYEQATAYCGLNIYGKFFVWDTKDCVITLNNYVPATKEQRDALLKAMADAGYEWDVKKKELKKIKQKQAIDCIDSHPKDNWELVHEFVETFGRMPEDEDELNVLVEYVLKRQKPTEWNEEDDYNLQCMIAKAVKDIQNGNVGRNQELINWLKSIKDRVQHQKQWKPSEEQLEFLKKCIESYNEVSFPTEFRVFRSLYNDLKKLAE